MAVGWNAQIVAGKLQEFFSDCDDPTSRHDIDDFMLVMEIPDGAPACGEIVDYTDRKHMTFKEPTGKKRTPTL